MKATTFSAFVVSASIALFSCQGTNSENNENRDTLGTVNSAPDTSATANQSTTANTTANLDENTREFMNKAALAGNTEVHMGQMAAQQATNPRVKAFGEMMVKDHTAANEELKTVAGQKNVTLPTGMKEGHDKEMEEMSKKKGNDWDKAFMKHMVDGHEDVIKSFEKASNDASDPDIKNWAAQKLPTLKMHLDSAKAIHKALK